MFPHLLPVESWLGALTHRTVRRGRIGHDHSLKQSQSLALSGSAKHAIPGVVCQVSRAGSGEKKDPAPSKDLLYLWFFLLSPICNPCSPLGLQKGGQNTPLMGRINSTHNTQPSSNRALSILSTFPSETWDLFLSRPFVPPTTNLFWY